MAEERLEEYKKYSEEGKFTGWYEIDGQSFREDKALEYLDEVAEFENAAAEEAELDAQAEAVVEGEKAEEGTTAVTSEDTKPEPLVAGKPDALPKDVVDAADGDTGAPTDNKNTPYERESYLVEMTRSNRMFEYPGEDKNYVFRHNAKILVVEGKDVEGLIAQGGFRIVTPEQAKSYYS